MTYLARNTVKSEIICVLHKMLVDYVPWFYLLLACIFRNYPGLNYSTAGELNIGQSLDINFSFPG
jgi:hypothetical protein